MTASDATARPPTLTVRGIDHVVFTARDIEELVAWYSSTLGLEAERLDEWRAGQVPFTSIRISAETIIDLVRGERTGENVLHIAMEVDEDIDELAESGRFDIIDGPSTLFGARGSGRGIYLRDPAGNVIELRSYR